MIRNSESSGRIFYVTDDVTVTEKWLVVGKRRMLISELHNPQVVRAPGSRTAGTMAVAALMLPLATGVIGTTIVGWATVGLGMVVALGIAAALRRGDPRPLVLHADYRGVNQPIFWSRDERLFGQVTRAILRAHEATRMPSGLTGKAAALPD